jgi:hypothetical protein
MNIRVSEGTVDQDAVARIGHVGELDNAGLTKQIIKLVLPARGDVVHYAYTRMTEPLCNQRKYARSWPL